MAAIFDYWINHELKINFDIMKGEVDLQSIIQHEQNRFSSDKFCQEYDTLVDIRGAVFENFMEEIKKFCTLLIDITSRNNINLNRKCAIVTATPTEVVHSVLFSSNIKQIGTTLKFETFSSEEAAVNWLRTDK